MILSSESIKNFYYADILYEIHKIEEKIKLFEKKYNLSFKDFEKKVKTRKNENFIIWDDYIEWKSYIKCFNDLNKKKVKVKHENFKVS